MGDDWLEQWLANARLAPVEFMVYGATTYGARLRHEAARKKAIDVFRNSTVVRPGSIPDTSQLMASPTAMQLLGSCRPLAITQRTLTLWRDVLLDLHVSDPILIVSATGSGKSAAVAALALIIGQRCQLQALTPESEPGDLIGQLTPSENKGSLVECVSRSPCHLFPSPAPLRVNGALKY